MGIENCGTYKDLHRQRLLKVFLILEFKEQGRMSGRREIIRDYESRYFDLDIVAPLIAKLISRQNGSRQKFRKEIFFVVRDLTFFRVTAIRL